MGVHRQRGRSVIYDCLVFIEGFILKKKRSRFFRHNVVNDTIGRNVTVPLVCCYCSHVSLAQFCGNS